MINIADSLNSAYANIKQLAIKHHRDPNSVELLAVSKTKPIELIVDAYQQGHRKFGENYASELDQKVKDLSQYPDIEWHFIGPIQSNKTKLVANNCDWVHSIDREKIATRLSEQREPNRGKLNVLIQVNIDAEPTKAGVMLEDVPALADKIINMPNLRFRGLMAIPQKSDDLGQQSHAFSQLNDCFVTLKTLYTHLDTLSMGMSGDIEAAIAQGSTMVRIGTAIFGAREPKRQ